MHTNIDNIHTYVYMYMSIKHPSSHRTPMKARGLQLAQSAACLPAGFKLAVGSLCAVNRAYPSEIRGVCGIWSNFDGSFGHCGFCQFQDAQLQKRLIHVCIAAAGLLVLSFSFHW